MQAKQGEPHDLEHDRRLAARIGTGDEAAFEELVEQRYPQVVRIVGRFFRQRERIEDVVQEVFVRVYTAIAAYRGEVPVEHWIAKIAVNACYDELRRTRSHPERPFVEFGAEISTFLENLAAPGAGDAAGVRQREEERLLAEQLLAGLPPAERLVLTLTVLEGMSTAEAAAVTGWSKANVKIRAFRARRRIRALFSEAVGAQRTR